MTSWYFYCASKATQNQQISQLTTHNRHKLEIWSINSGPADTETEIGSTEKPPTQYCEITSDPEGTLYLAHL